MISRKAGLSQKPIGIELKSQNDHCSLYSLGFSDSLHQIEKNNSKIVSLEKIENLSNFQTSSREYREYREVTLITTPLFGKRHNHGIMIRFHICPRDLWGKMQSSDLKKTKTLELFASLEFL